MRQFAALPEVVGTAPVLQDGPPQPAGWPPHLQLALGEEVKEAAVPRGAQPVLRTASGEERPGRNHTYNNPQSKATTTATPTHTRRRRHHRDPQWAK